STSAGLTPIATSSSRTSARASHASTVARSASTWAADSVSSEPIIRADTGAGIVAPSTDTTSTADRKRDRFFNDRFFNDRFFNIWDSGRVGVAGSLHSELRNPQTAAHKVTRDAQ